MLRRIPRPLLQNYIVLALLAPVVTHARATVAYSISDSLDVRPAFLQTMRILGKVTDESSRPVANAAVLIAGSERGTITNLSGSFEIADAPLNGMLVVKHPDFETRQVPIVKSAGEYVIALKTRQQTAAMRLKTQPKLSKKDTEQNYASENGSSIRLDRWPYFRGLTKFLANNLKYPEEALKAGVQGAVQVSFLIDEDGGVSSGRIVKSPGIELDDEALRLVTLMPKWTPAQKDGKPVAVWYTISIRFDPEVDKLPLKIKEEVPKLFGRWIKFDQVKTPLPVKAEFKRLFYSNAVDLSAQKPPQTRIYIYEPGNFRPAYIPPKFDFNLVP
ncbi:TonB family protein [Dyadobacter soli]|nr:TonB family protein [Dyadobacter soli]